MEKVKQIEISNFKSIKHLKIDGCNTINIFVGMPNAGKSNILEAMGLFGFFNFTLHKKQIKDFVRYDDLYQLFYQGNVKEISEIKINSLGKLYLTLKNVGGLETDGLYYGFKGKDETLFNSASDTNLAIIKKYSFKTIDNQKIGDFELEFPFGENIGQIISQNEILRHEVAEYLKDNGLKIVIKSGNYEFAIQRDLPDYTVFQLPYNMIADTLQRLIFYKAAIMSNENAVLLFEEPEAHCFEPYILEFTNAIKYDKNDNQYFIVTHSDYIIQEFLRDEESKQNTNIYLVNNVDGETQVKLLDKAKNDDVYEYGMNLFFNFESLWDNN